MSAEPEADPRTPDFWADRLDEWLALIRVTDDAGPRQPTFYSSSFPTNEALHTYLTTIHERDENEVRALLRRFLFPPTTFGADASLVGLGEYINYPIDETRMPPEYMRSLHGIKSGSPAQPGLRWTMDLLPERPHAALHVIESYTYVYCQFLPDWRLNGLSDASALIRARWINPSLGEAEDARAALRDQRPREFEVLVAAAYRKLGYQVTLTRATRDGGRDVEAFISRDGIEEHLMVECKQYAGAVGVEVVRNLLGVIAKTRSTTGVVVTTGRFSKDAIAFARGEGQLNLIDMEALVAFLAASLGKFWYLRVEGWLATAST